MAGGKIYATPEQKAVMMEVYEADNYPEVSLLTDLSNSLGLSLEWVRQWFMYTRKVMRKQGKEPMQKELKRKSAQIEVKEEEEVARSKRRKVKTEEVTVTEELEEKGETYAEEEESKELDRHVISHEEALEKALMYDILKEKFEDLHQKFLRLSEKVLDQEESTRPISIPPTDSTSPPAEPRIRGKSGEQEKPPAPSYPPYMYPGFPPYPPMGYPSYPYPPAPTTEHNPRTRGNSGEQEKPPASTYPPYMYPGYPYPPMGYPPYPYTPAPPAGDHKPFIPPPTTVEQSPYSYPTPDHKPYPYPPQPYPTPNPKGAYPYPHPAYFPPSPGFYPPGFTPPQMKKESVGTEGR